MGVTLKYSLTNSSLTIILDGEAHVFQKGALNFIPLRDACLADDLEGVLKNLTMAKGIEQWTQGMFTVQGDTMSYQGDPLPQALNKRIIEMAGKGENPTPLMRFWERLMGCPEKGLPGNPSYRSVEQLWSFLDNKGIPLDQDGFILGYKGVKRDFTDKWTGQVDNHVGTTNKMPRNKVSDDPNVACHYGFHCGSLEYVRNYARCGEPIIIVRVDPADVVCIPHDSNCQKMRMCAYTVVGIFGGDREQEYLPSTTMSTESPVPDEELVDLDEDWEDYYLYEDEDEVGPTITKVTPNKTPPKSPAAPKKHKTLDEGTVSTRVAPKTKTQWKDQFDKLSGLDLADQGIVELRKYASHDLKIAGAFKIPGGKRALITQIIRVRGY